MSYQKFKTVIISCNADETELKHWKRKGASVVAIPFILCLIVLLLFIYAIFPVNTTDKTVVKKDILQKRLYKEALLKHFL